MRGERNSAIGDVNGGIIQTGYNRRNEE